MESKNKYKLMLDVAEVAIQCEGTVFGGYVRDFILHDESAKRFYSSHPTEEYQNKEVSPETHDRFLTANDIDIMFKTYGEYRNFTEALKQRYFTLRVVHRKHVYPHGGRQIRLAVSMCINIQKFITIGSCLTKEVITSVIKDIPIVNVPGSTFTIDVVIGAQSQTMLDYECNGLILDSRGVGLGEQLSRNLSPVGKYRELERIKGDIIAKKAVTLGATKIRWDKMAERGDWEIVGGLVEKKIVPGEMCIVCHDTITYTGAFKLECCAACYHKECAAKIITNHVSVKRECPHCRKDLNITESEVQTFGV